MEWKSRLAFPSDEKLVRRVRRASGVDAGEGPDDDDIADAVKAVAATFEYWYSRVMKQAVHKYRDLIIGRINPYIRRMQLRDMTPEEAADVLVSDYDRRNYVTAGGWALEAMAVNIGPNAEKSLVEGVDLQRLDEDNLHLCVLKSGTVTRNSDILKALKNHVRRAEKLHKQVKTKKGEIIGDYVQMTGCTTPTHTEDGIRRPSSAQFWSEVTELEPDDAIEVTLAVAAEAARIASPDASSHVDAMKLLVEEYIKDPEDPGEVDWEFIAERNMRERSENWDWSKEDQERDQRGRSMVARTGYEIYIKPKKTPSKKTPSKKTPSKKKSRKR